MEAISRSRVSSGIGGTEMIATPTEAGSRSRSPKLWSTRTESSPTSAGCGARLEGTCTVAVVPSITTRS